MPSPATGSRRLATATIAWGLLVLLALGAAPRPPRLEPPADEAVWITLGADAMPALEASDIRLAGAPPVRFAERDGVVLTRVRRQDLAAVSAVLHQATRRCAGFLAHASLERAWAALAGRVAPEIPLAYTIDQPEAVARLTAAIDPEGLLATIADLSTLFDNRYHAYQSGYDAALWIRDLWTQYAAGRPDVTVGLFEHAATPQPSVLATIQGATLPDEVVVLGGHLDSVTWDGPYPGFLAPGADDDASGVAVVGEALRVAMAEGFRPRRTVVFIGYAAEEIGLVGSQEIAAAFRAAGTDVVAVLQQDMTAYQGSVEDIGILTDHTDPALTLFLKDLVVAYQPELAWAWTACGYGCSDHASWDFEGFPAAMAFESRFGQHNPAIHTVNDTTAYFGDTPEHAAKFARLATAFMVEAAKEGVMFADGFESGDTSAWDAAVP